jgi:HEAT repeat protein
VETPSAAPEVVSMRLSELLADQDPDMRRTAAEALGKIGRRSSMAALIAALQDGEAGVRAAAALSLGRIGEAESAPALVRSLADPAEIVRVAAAMALGEIESSPFSETLILARLHHLDDAERLAAGRALLGFDTVSFSHELVDALQDSSPRIRQVATAVLGESGDARAIPLLLTLLQSDRVADVRSEAAFRLGKIGDDLVVGKLEKIAETDQDVRVRGWARWASQQITLSRESDSATRPSR